MAFQARMYTDTETATVTIRLMGSNGSYIDRTCTTDSTGRCTVSYSGVPSSLSPGTAQVRSVTSSPTWDGVMVTTTIAP